MWYLLRYSAIIKMHLQKADISLLQRVKVPYTQFFKLAFTPWLITSLISFLHFHTNYLSNLRITE